MHVLQKKPVPLQQLCHGSKPVATGGHSACPHEASHCTHAGEAKGSWTEEKLRGVVLGQILALKEGGAWLKPKPDPESETGLE